MSTTPLRSALILSSIGLASKAFLRLGTKSLDVKGLPILLNALGYNDSSALVKGKAKEEISDDKPDSNLNLVSPMPRRGIVTVCNHNSVVDDPMMWSLLPTTHFFPFSRPSHVCFNSRWTLGASDIMFTNPVLSRFFSMGQVIETHRGGGIFQPAVDEAVKRVQEGGWVHIFPEGKVNQEKSNPAGGLLRFKWGVGRIIMDSKVMPEIIPIWISGFDQIMNEYRGFPRMVPRTGARITITVGEPLTPLVSPLVDSWRELASHEPGQVGLGGEWSEGGDERAVRGSGAMSEGREEDVRKRIVQVLQDGVQRLGEGVERGEGRFDGEGRWSHSVTRERKAV